MSYYSLGFFSLFPPSSLLHTAVGEASHFPDSALVVTCCRGGALFSRNSPRDDLSPVTYIKPYCCYVLGKAPLLPYSSSGVKFYLRPTHTITSLIFCIKSSKSVVCCAVVVEIPPPISFFSIISSSSSFSSTETQTNQPTKQASDNNNTNTTTYNN